MSSRWIIFLANVKNDSITLRHMTNSHTKMLIFCFQLQKLLCPILLKGPDGGRRDHIEDLGVNVPTSLYANAPEACFACICLRVILLHSRFLCLQEKMVCLLLFPNESKTKPDFPMKQVIQHACAVPKYLGPLAEWKCNSQPRRAAPVCHHRGGNCTPVACNHSRQHVLPLPTSFTFSMKDMQVLS